MPELEEFSALVGDILTRPDAPAGSFQQLGAGGDPGFTDRFEKGSGEILDIIKVAPNPDFAPFLQRITE